MLRFLLQEPRRVPSSADDGRKEISVISGDMRVGNDTSHDGQGDFSARIEPCPSCIPLPKKAFFDRLKPTLSGRAYGRLSKNPPGEEPRRVESSADDGRKGSSVISGDMRVGNDTSHDGQGDFSARIEPCPSCIPLSKKAKGLFRQAEENAPAVHRTAGAFSIVDACVSGQ